MADPSDILKPGTMLDRNVLVRAIRTVEKKPGRGVGGVQVRSVGQQDTFRKTGHQIIPRVKPIPAITLGATLIPLAGIFWRWDYEWVKAEISALGLWQGIFGGEGDAEFGLARNFAEQSNVEFVAAGGVVLNPTDPVATGEVLPIPIGMPVQIGLFADTAGVRKPWFSMMNAVNFVCGTP